MNPTHTQSPQGTGRAASRLPNSKEPVPPTLADGKKDPHEEDTQDAMDKALADSFPASDPPGHSSPTRTGSASPKPAGTNKR